MELSIKSSLLISRRRVVSFVGGALTASGRLNARLRWPVLRKRQLLVPLVDDAGEIEDRYEASSLHWVEDLGANTCLRMSIIPGGVFTMGSDTVVDPLLPEERPLHEVTVRPFALASNPITRRQWRRACDLPQIDTSLHVINRQENLPPGVEEQLPADLVSFAEAEEYCRRLAHYTGRPYRLPSEAEWEYACRAGTSTVYHFGNAISRTVANFNDGYTRPLALDAVGSREAPNRYGLHDMHGQVFEWCSDWLHYDYTGAPSDGRAWIYDGNSAARLQRGGNYLSNAGMARSAARFPGFVGWTSSGDGVRVAVDIPFGFNDPICDATGVVNAASESPGPVCPGEIVKVYGKSIGPNEPMYGQLEGGGVLVTEILSTRVLIDGVPAPLLYVSAEQIDVIVPYRVKPESAIRMVVERHGQTSIPVRLDVVSANPAIFSQDGSGRGQVWAFNENGTPNSVANPARVGAVVTFFATGQGHMEPSSVAGRLAEPPFSKPILPISVDVAGEAAVVEYAGASAGHVNSLLRVEIRVPAQVQGGLLPVVLRVGPAMSQPGVYIAVG